MMGGATHNTQFGMPQVGGGMHGAGVLGGGSGVQHMGAGYVRHDTQSIFHKNKPRPNTLLIVETRSAPSFRAASVARWGCPMQSAEVEGERERENETMQRKRGERARYPMRAQYHAGAASMRDLP